MDAAGWDERYRGSELVWKAEPNRFVEQELAGLEPSGRAVDIAAGEGRNAVWLAVRGWEVDAVDFSAVALEKARRLAAERDVRLRTVHADLLDWAPAAATYDLALIAYLQLPWPCGTTSGLEDGVDGAVADEVAGAALCSARGRAAVPGRDRRRPGHAERTRACLRHLGKMRVRSPLRQAPESPRTPRDASSERCRSGKGPKNSRS